MAIVAMLALPVSARAQAETSADATVTRFEDWSLRCVQETGAQGQGSRCQLMQSAAASATYDVFLLSVAFADGASIATAVVTVPLGVYLANDIHIFVDGRQAFVLRYEICDQRACYAGFEMQEALVSSWRRGMEARFRVWTGRERAVEFPVSLRGFTAAWEAFEEASMERRRAP